MTLILILLRLYPKRFRDDFAIEMLATYHEAATDHRLRGKFAYRFFMGRELVGLAHGLFKAWLACFVAEFRINHERWTRAAHYLTACSLAVILHALFYGDLLPIGKATVAATNAGSMRISLYGMLFAIFVELCSFVLGRAIQAENE